MTTLFKTEAEFRQYTGTSVALSIESLEPYLTFSLAENEIIKICTQSLYDSLLTAYDENTLNQQANSHLKALLPFVQKPLASLAVYHYLQEGPVMITDGGVETNREKTAFQWQQEKVEQHYLRQAYFGLDQLITFLIKNVSNYNNWDKSEAYKQGKGSIITNATELQQYVNIGESHRTFIALLPTLKNTERQLLKSYLSPGLFEALIGALKSSNSLPQEYSNLLEYARPALAYSTMVEALDDHNLEVSPEGVIQHSLKTVDQNIKGKLPAKPDAIDQYKTRMSKRAKSWLLDLRNFLNTKASSTLYAEYFNSDTYEDPDKSNEVYQQNKESNIWNGL